MKKYERVRSQMFALGVGKTEWILWTEIRLLSRNAPCFAGIPYLCESLDVSRSRMYGMLKNMRELELIQERAVGGRRVRVALTPREVSKNAIAARKGLSNTLRSKAVQFPGSLISYKKYPSISSQSEEDTTTISLRSEEERRDPGLGGCRTLRSVDRLEKEKEEALEHILEDEEASEDNVELISNNEERPEEKELEQIGQQEIQEQSQDVPEGEPGSEYSEQDFLDMLEKAPYAQDLSKEVDENGNIIEDNVSRRPAHIQELYPDESAKDRADEEEHQAKIVAPVFGPPALAPQRRHVSGPPVDDHEGVATFGPMDHHDQAERESIAQDLTQLLREVVREIDPVIRVRSRIVEISIWHLLEIRTPWDIEAVIENLPRNLFWLGRVIHNGISEQCCNEMMLLVRQLHKRRDAIIERRAARKYAQIQELGDNDPGYEKATAGMGIKERRHYISKQNRKWLLQNILTTEMCLRYEREPGFPKEERNIVTMPGFSKALYNPHFKYLFKPHFDKWLKETKERRKRKAA